MMKCLNLLLLVGFLLLNSCMSEKDFLMRRVRPAAYTFPENCKSVLFVNNLWQTDSTRYLNNITLQNDQTKIFEAIVGEALNQNFFDSIHTVQQTVPKSFSRIVEENYPQADIAVILSELNLRSTRYTGGENPSLILLGSIELNLFVPDGSSESRHIELRDTVYANQYEELMDPSYLYYLMIQNTCENLIGKVATYLLPYSIEENRKIFSWSDINTRDAVKYLTGGNTQNARIIWTELLNIERKPLHRAYLYSNLAFLAENENQEEKALDFIRSALAELNSSSRKNNTGLSNYLKKTERSILEKQKESELLKRQIRN